LPVLASGRRGLLLRHQRWGELRLALLGRHQALNAAVALGIIDALERAGVAAVSEEAVRSGLAGARWPGRLEILEPDGLTIVIDGAHNPAGIAALSATLEELAPELPSGPATLLLGILRDKEVDEMVELLSGCALLERAAIVATRVPDTERALPAADLGAAWQRVSGRPAVVVDDPDEALDRALAIARRAGGPLIIAGSLYLVGRLRARLVPGVLVDDLT
jgi:dihydrofolate synthase/folylpolyglutamate synthase